MFWFPAEPPPLLLRSGGYPLSPAPDSPPFPNLASRIPSLPLPSASFASRHTRQVISPIRLAKGHGSLLLRIAHRRPNANGGESKASSSPSEGEVDPVPLCAAVYARVKRERRTCHHALRIAPLQVSVACLSNRSSSLRGFGDAAVSRFATYPLPLSVGRLREIATPPFVLHPFPLPTI